MPFIDLKAQYKALKSSIDSRIQKVLDHGAYVNGPEVAELETKLAQHTGTKYALACASGTDALVIPMMALGIGPGDEVITTAFSFIATAETICLVGAKPIYVDIDPATYNIDIKAIEKAITPKTKAIIPVSLYGQMADMDEINALAKKHNLHVIEDAAQSYGASYKDRKSSNASIVGATSFFPAKPLGCYGDGGAIFTNDEKLNKAMKEIREHGSETRYYHTRLGVNGRLDTIQCAILLSKLERYDWEVEQRQKIADRYNSAFAAIKTPGFVVPLVKSDRKSVWAQYTLAVPNRADFQKKLTDAGVPTSVHYPRTMPDQPWYKENTPCTHDISKARHAADHVISLPMYPDMDTATQDKIIAAVISAMK
ncbi:DegT/DnrJ/EryC1/StrS family aminotransferase [Bdellovibrio sp. HCB337]|uniref:DegT/DnrJ/EryC1/StrS family aminotransferase n=1 Tax=Bdellovibrio sp. HCB337 TaxID=3394358 RepID=UPI0039A442F9